MISYLRAEHRIYETAGHVLFWICRNWELAVSFSMQASAQYEAFVAGLARALLRNRDASEVRSGFRNHLAGASGVRHQIDVSFLDRSTTPHTLVVIECKHLRRPVKLAHVKVVKATVDDLAQRLPEETVKGVLVSLRGAQRGAIDYARHYNIDLQLVSDGSFYHFKYADLELIASSGLSSGHSHVSARGVALRACTVCGSEFESDGSLEVCPTCTRK